MPTACLDVLPVGIFQEVAARFIPRFYYEGPFTPVEEEEKEEAKHRVEAAASDATVAALAVARRTSSRGEGRRRDDRSAHRPPPAKDKPNFLETSATLLAARRWARPGSGGAAPDSALSASDALDGGRLSTTTAAEIGPAGEVRHPNRNSSLWVSFWECRANP